MKPVGPFKPPYVLAEDLNALADEVARLGKLSVEGADLDQSPGGPLLRVPSHEMPIPAKVTEAGDATDDDTIPHSWVQQRPAEDGTWEDDPNGLSGNADGSGAGPLFAMDGGEIAVDSVVWARKGYVGLVDGEVRQEWLILGGAGGGAVARQHVLGKPWCVGGRQYYPSRDDVIDAGGLGFHDGPTDRWLLQRDGEPLDTRGVGHYTAKRELAAFTVTTDAGDDTRELWVTTELIFVRDVICNGDGTIDVVDSGVFEGCRGDDWLTVDGEQLTFDGVLVGVN